MEEKTEMETKVIFKMSWFATKRHSVPHTMMYFALLEDTFWGLDGDWCGGRITRITVIKVLENSSEYESAIENSANQYHKKNTKNVMGVRCNECDNILPPHTEDEHFDDDNPIHTCPHELNPEKNLLRKYFYKLKKFKGAYFDTVSLYPSISAAQAM